MADMESESEAKRKRSELSSISELDTSSNSPKTDTKPKKKKSKSMSGKKQTEHNTNEGKSTEADSSIEMTRQLSEINKKLSNVITKDDGFLRELIREMFQQMKDEFLKSVSHRIDILEGKLFEKEEENDRLRNAIAGLNKEIDSQKSENLKLLEQLERNSVAADERINDLEQYGRRNNIRINGIPEAGEESPEKTSKVVIETLNRYIENLDLKREEIDIAHRLGKKKEGRHRQIILKFQSRMKRDTVLNNRKVFKGSDIFVNEDLTRINQQVLACVRKKMTDEVERAWTRNGRVFYKTKTDTVLEVKYKEFQHWIDLPWPQ